MKKMVCEICESNNIVKKDGLFECQNCGTQYSVEEAKKLLKEVGEVIQEKPKEDNNKIYNFLNLANDSLMNGDYELAVNYANKALEIDSEIEFAWYIKGISATIIEKDGDFSKSIKKAKDNFIKAISYADYSDLEMVKGMLHVMMSRLCAAFNKEIKYTLEDLYNSENCAFNEFKMYIAKLSLVAYGEVTLELEIANHARALECGINDGSEKVEVPVWPSITPALYKTVYDSLVKRASKAIAYQSSDLVTLLAASHFFPEQFVDLIEGDLYKSYAIKYSAEQIEKMPIMVHELNGNVSAKTMQSTIKVSLEQANKLRANEWYGVEQKLFKSNVEEYWVNHPDEREELEREKDEIKNSLFKTEDELKVLLEEKESLIQQRDKKLSERKNLGLFKGKEKAIIDEELEVIRKQILSVETNIKNSQKEYDEEKKVNDLKIEEIERRIETGDGKVQKIDVSKEFNAPELLNLHYSKKTNMYVPADIGKDYNQKKSSVIKEAIIGGVIAGPVGAVIGAVHAADKNNRR